MHLANHCSTFMARRNGVLRNAALRNGLRAQLRIPNSTSRDRATKGNRDDLRSLHENRPARLQRTMSKKGAKKDEPKGPAENPYKVKGNQAFQDKEFDKVR